MCERRASIPVAVMQLAELIFDINRYPWAESRVIEVFKPGDSVIQFALSSFALGANK